MDKKTEIMQGVNNMLEISENNLAKYNEGYKEGFSDGYDSAKEQAREVVEKYNLDNKQELKPARRFLDNSFGDQLNKIHSEYVEVISAYMNNEGRDRVAEEIVDVQEACETALAILGLTVSERTRLRLDVIEKNEIRGYYKE